MGALASQQRATTPSSRYGALVSGRAIRKDLHCGRSADDNGGTIRDCPRRVGQTLCVALAGLIVAIIAAAAAVAAVWLAWRSRSESKRSATAAELSADEARKARLDAGGPRLAVEPIRGLSMRWLLPSYPSDRVPLPYHPGKGLVWPGNGEHRLYLGAAFTVRNEGEGTVDLRVSGWPLFDATFEEDTDYPGTPDEEIQRKWRAGRYQIRPGAQTVVVLRDGPTLNDIHEAGDGNFVTTFTVAATDPLGLVTDTWTVTAEGLIAGQSNEVAGQWRIAAWIETKVSMTGPVRTYG